MKLLSTLLMMVLLVTACGEKKEKATTDEVVETEMAEMEETMEENMASETIVGVASGNENFSTLVAAVTAADLVGTLNSDGPFTVFAPTNDSFAKLPAGTVESYCKPENKPALDQPFNISCCIRELSSGRSCGSDQC